MKSIQLTKGKKVLIDSEDYPVVSRFKWHCHKSSMGLNYAATELGCNGKSFLLYMHRLLVRTRRFERIDHVNGDGLDNRKNNLRVSNAAQNQWNKGIQKNNRSGFKGVSVDARSGKFKTSIKVNGKEHYLGLFEKASEAAMEYDAAALNHFGAYAKTNASMGLL